MRLLIVSACTGLLACCSSELEPIAAETADCAPDIAPLDTWPDGTTVTLYNARLRVKGEPALVATLYNEDGSEYVGVGRVYLEQGVARVSCGAAFERAGELVDYPAAYAVFAEEGGR